MKYISSNVFYTHDLEENNNITVQQLYLKDVDEVTFFFLFQNTYHNLLKIGA